MILSMTPEHVQNLNAGGWAVMIGCVGLVLAMCVFCFRRVMREPSPSERHHAPLDIDTHDTDE